MFDTLMYFLPHSTHRSRTKRQQRAQVGRGLSRVLSLSLSLCLSLCATDSEQPAPVLATRLKGKRTGTTVCKLDTQKCGGLLRLPGGTS